MAFQGGLTPGRYPTKEINETRVMEIAPDIWMIEGYVSDNFFFKPPSSNCFILRDRDMVLLIDTGTYPHYREKILTILEKYRRDGARRLVLMLTQGHFDHVCNNDIILEAGYSDVRFLVPEDEVSTLDIYNHWTGEYREVMEYYNPYREMDFAFPTAIPNIASRISMALAQRMVDGQIAKLFRGVKTMAEDAEILPNASRITRRYGDVEFTGWEIGRFFAIHDATHSPGHLSFYDPEHKAFLTGDATLEINPPFFNSNLNNCIMMMGKFKRFAELGYVKLATDSHRSVNNATRLISVTKGEPLHKLQVIDTVEGEDCIEFYSFFEKYYTALKNEVLSILKRRREATVHQIIQDLKASEDPYVQFKVFIRMPKLPSRLEILVANVLKEQNIAKRREDNKIIFSYQ
jgi:glyoxylase-like metal-dependent hydrolase (beta-lactamase superfamily II)